MLAGFREDFRYRGWLREPGESLGEPQPRRNVGDAPDQSERFAGSEAAAGHRRHRPALRFALPGVALRGCINIEMRSLSCRV